MMNVSSRDGLILLGGAYLSFLDSAGQADDRSFEEPIPKLFDPSFTKIVNGKTMLTSSSELGSYLWEAQKTYGKWNIDKVYDLYPSESTGTVTLNYIAETEKAKLLVISILKINAGKISEVVEVDHVLS